MIEGSVQPFFSYLFAVLDRYVLEGAEQVSDSLPLARTSVINHCKFDSLIFQFLLRNLLNELLKV